MIKRLQTWNELLSLLNSPKWNTVYDHWMIMLELRYAAGLIDIAEMFDGEGHLIMDDWDEHYISQWLDELDVNTLVTGRNSRREQTLINWQADGFHYPVTVSVVDAHSANAAALEQVRDMVRGRLSKAHPDIVYEFTEDTNMPTNINRVTLAFSNRNDAIQFKLAWSK